MLSAILGLVLLADPLSSPVTHYDAPERELVITTDWRAALSQDPELEALAVCESGINEKAVNKEDSDGEPKYGVWQYDADTWIAFQIEMGIEPTLNIYSGRDQLRVTRWALANGKASHWGICL